MWRGLREFKEALDAVPTKIMPDLKVIIIKAHTILGVIIKDFRLDEPEDE